MVLRLVLVGIVAGLGISPPANGELAGWTRSVQTWLDARIAEADAGAPLDEDGGALTFDDEAPAAKQAESKVSDRDEEADALADFDLEAIDDELAAGSAVAPSTAPPALVEDRELTEGLAFDAVVEEMVAEFANFGTGEVAKRTDYEPLEVGDELYPGEGYALNRTAEGLDEAATAVCVPAGNQLSNAVRLTRDAVYAWMNLIQSPAIMTIPR